MPQTLSLTREVQVFPCPNCGQTINTSMQNCRFCGALLDSAASLQAADEMSRVSQAVNEASYIRILAGVAFTFIFLRFVPFIGLIGIFGFAFLEIALPGLLIRWWFRYGRMKTTDSDFPQAKRIVVLVTAGVLLFFLLRITKVLLIAPF